jgi:hypothetical protein
MGADGFKRLAASANHSSEEARIFPPRAEETRSSNVSVQILLRQSTIFVALLFQPIACAKWISSYGYFNWFNYEHMIKLLNIAAPRWLRAA